MNYIALDIADLNLQNIYFQDFKKNRIMNGIFTKIMYTSEWFTMNGIYLYLPLVIETVVEKPYLQFSANTSQNKNILNALYLLEKNIIDTYCKNCITEKKSEKIHNYGLSRWLQCGQIRIHNYKKEFFEKKLFVLKISGVWESATEMGITYKLIETSQIQ
jgi:hypothetical protein